MYVIINVEMRYFLSSTEGKWSIYISYLFFNVSNTSKGLYYFPEIAVEL